MQYRPVTPSCERILQRFSTWTLGQGDETPTPRHLVAALLAEESLGGQRLTDLGIGLPDVLSNTDEHLLPTPGQQMLPSLGGEFAAPPDFNGKALSSVWCRPVLERAFAIARRLHGTHEVSSEHLLQAMVELDGPVNALLASVGVDTATLLEHLQGPGRPEESPLALDVDFELHPDLPPMPLPEADFNSKALCPGQPVCSALPADDVPFRVLTVVDANLNRAREGLRVLEDFARFVCRDKDVTSRLKHLRHSLVTCEKELRNDVSDLLSHRNTAADAGTEITTTGESSRQSLADVVVANARRIQESLRSLEEFGKLISPSFAAQIKQLRYESYNLEQRLTPDGTDDSREAVELRYQRTARLESAQLYVLVSEANCHLNWRDVVEKSLLGGADVVQLREKSLSPDEIVHRARWVAAACRSHDALFILNDSCDAAVAACADGVHIGQQDGTVAEARQLLAPSMLLGVSTHNKSQLVRACSQEIDYLGVGPVFRSDTKSFDTFPGTEYIAQAAEFADRPWFAIGGIDAANLDVAQKSGAQRIAVSNAVIGSADPEQAARQLKQRLQCAASAFVPQSVRFEHG
ncbi:MAG: thiamine phosphate synthase [Fuerstiella sp.]|nr:thiamine phosphate synthase [Fuerstiella sp.]